MADKLVKYKITFRGRGLVFPPNILFVLLFVSVFDILWFGTAAEFTLLQGVLTLPLLFFFPGYLLLDIAVPQRPIDENSGSGNTQSKSNYQLPRIPEIGWKERLALAFGLSLAVIPLLGLAIAPIAGSLAAEYLVVGLNVYILAGSLAAFVRHNLLSVDQQFQAQHGEWRVALKRALSGGNRLDKALSVVLVLAVIITVGTLTFALLAPQQGEAYTTTTLLTETSDGDLAAADLPTEFTRGDDETMGLRIENNEGAETTYTFVVELQRIDDSSGGSVSVVIQEETLLQRENTLSPGETWTELHSVEPTLTGDNLRLAYHVYRGEPPENPSSDDPFRTLYHWVDVSLSEG